MIDNLIMRKGISFLLITALILSGFFLTPNISHGLTMEKTVTKYHLDIGAQHIWGTGTTPETASWESGHAPNTGIDVDFTLDMGQKISNVKVYQYSSSKFKWNAEGYTYNANSYLNSQNDFKKYYEKYMSNNIYNIQASSSGNKVSISYTAQLTPKEEPFDLKQKLIEGNLPFVLEVLGGEESVKTTQPKTYQRLKDGANGNLADTLHGQMYFTPVIIQYDVKEMVELPDPDPESIDAELEAPSAVKAGEGFNVSDDTIVGAQTVVKTAELYRTIDGERELIDTWLGSGSKGKNTGGTTYQKIDVPTTAKYDLVVTTEKGLTDTDTKTVVIEDGRSISGQVDLEVDPKITHEGHPVDAYDFSTYQITEDKETRDVSAKYAYEEGFASNRYYAPDGKIKKDGYDAIVTFPVKGTYPITLEVRLKGNSDKMTDKENVQVLKTPYIYDTLSGFQKQKKS